MGGDVILERRSHEHIAVFVDPEETGSGQLTHNLVNKATLKQQPQFLQLAGTTVNRDTVG